MKIQISAKNYPMSDKLSNYIEKSIQAQRDSEV